MQSILVSSIEGNRQRLDGGSMFGNAPRAVWEKWHEPDEQGRIELACRCLLIEIEGKRILCETGIGAYMEPKLATRFGVWQKEHILLASLAERGLSDHDIDFVILSHLHFDHAGGLLSSFQDGQDPFLLFPKAKFIVGKTAFERCVHPHLRDRASFIPNMAAMLQQSSRLILVDGDHCPELFPNQIMFLYSDGHTPGQMHTIVHGQKNTMFFAGDLIPGTAWIHLPITMGYDRFPEVLIDEKQSLYKTLVKKNWSVFFTHDPSVAAANIAADEKGRYTAQAPLVQLDQFPL